MNAEEFLAQQAQLNVDTGLNKPQTPEERRKFNLAGIFLSKVKSIYGIEKIYYPGSTDISVLESAFSPEEIIYLDRKIKRTDSPNAVLGDYLKPPFDSKTFDAVFLNDIHLHEGKGLLNSQQALGQILETVKDNGVVIVGKRYACPEWEKELDFYVKRPELKPVGLQLQNPDFALFLKAENPL